MVTIALFLLCAIYSIWFVNKLFVANSVDLSCFSNACVFISWRANWKVQSCVYLMIGGAVIAARYSYSSCKFCVCLITLWVICLLSYSGLIYWVLSARRASGRYYYHHYYY